VSEESEDIRRKIMNEGFPLQRYTAKVLQKLGWVVDEEYPVMQSSVSIEPEVIRTSGDIRAAYVHNNEVAIRTCISCKRQHNINWAFMKSMNPEETHTLVRQCVVKDYLDQDRVQKYDFEFNGTKWKGANYDLCNIPTTLHQRNKAKDEDKIIQTCDSLYFEVLQSEQDDEPDLYAKTISSRQVIYVPVIVTAAQIHSYDVDETNFDVENADAVNITRVPFLLYQHRLPQHMRPILRGSSDYGQLQLDRMYIFVVFYEHVEEFYKGLMSSFASHDIPLPPPITY
jgi:hypothetical protein